MIRHVTRRRTEAYECGHDLAYRWFVGWLAEVADPVEDGVVIGEDVRLRFTEFAGGVGPWLVARANRVAVGRFMMCGLVELGWPGGKNLSRRPITWEGLTWRDDVEGDDTVLTRVRSALMTELESRAEGGRMTGSHGVLDRVERRAEERQAEARAQGVVFERLGHWG